MGLQSLSVQGFLYHKAGLSLVPGPGLFCLLQEAGASAETDHPTLSCGQGLLLASCDDVSLVLDSIEPEEADELGLEPPSSALTQWLFSSSSHYCSAWILYSGHTELLTTDPEIDCPTSELQAMVPQDFSTPLIPANIDYERPSGSDLSCLSPPPGSPPDCLTRTPAHM